MGIGHYRWESARFDVAAKLRELEKRIEQLEKEKAETPVKESRPVYTSAPLQCYCGQDDCDYR